MNSLCTESLPLAFSLTFSMYLRVTKARKTSDSSIPAHMASTMLPCMCVSSNQGSNPLFWSSSTTTRTSSWLVPFSPQSCDTNTETGLGDDDIVQGGRARGPACRGVLRFSSR